jgi:phage terminase large subunit GpA-like protein
MAKITLEKLDPAREPKRKKTAVKTIEAKKVQVKNVETQVTQSVHAHKVIEGERQPNTNGAGVREFAGRAYLRASLRREVWRRAHGKCTGCGGYYRLQIDHIKPVAKGGTNTLENLRLLCFHCNQRQADLKLGRERMEGFRSRERGRPST